MPQTMQHWMNLAIKEAEQAAQIGEMPVGAVVVLNDQCIARAHNLREQTHDPTAHAEILALRQAAQAVGDWRLAGATLYVTLEPCPMCAGAIVGARVSRLVYGASDPQTGCAGSRYQLTQDPALGGYVEVIAGVEAEACAQLLTDFFANKR